MDAGEIGMDMGSVNPDLAISLQASWWITPDGV